MKQSKSFCYIALFIFVLIGCEYKPTVTATRGSTHMLVSEDISSIISKEVEEFERYYPEAKISYSAIQSRDAVVQLLNDSVKLIAIPRNLNPEEWEVVKKYKLYIDTFKVAYDGLLLFVNKNNPLNQITTEELHKILSGNKKSWKNGNKIIIATGSSNSGLNEFLQKGLLQNSKIGAIIYPCSTSKQVIDLVSKNELLLGIIGSSWLNNLPEECKIISVGDKNYQRESNSTLEYFTPHPAHIYRNYYPLKRPIYLVGRNLIGGVEDGFITFVSSINGQKIFTNNNLVPATMPVRLISLTSE